MFARLSTTLLYTLLVLTAFVAAKPNPVPGGSNDLKAQANRARTAVGESQTIPVHWQ
ncbi:hypothetical protein K503DRAFT_184512 [Rhizopogon vinicolor AM-OR11-026]|uniref:Uncharacterized protein n=1 Tax=Rhizopogon vinicolor AM-OR11-026 TaxID=1314800 RepID=A0A1B7MZT3_9AGAM|nr:hypothetical protein K503DRAFT_184512 [Rhizopogon vinicolor AM-OR11-026]